MKTKKKEKNTKVTKVMEWKTNCWKDGNITPFFFRVYEDPSCSTERQPACRPSPICMHSFIFSMGLWFELQLLST